MICSLPSIPVETTPAKILGHLYPPGPSSQARHTRVADLAEEAARLTRDLIRPAGVFRMLPAEETAPWPPTARGEFMFLGLVTLGGALDAACQDLRTEGHDTRALFLDAGGAVAVEAACETLEETIGRECRERRLKKTRRASPGYGAFPLTDQRRVFDLLPAGELGVKLTAECMMVPLKSVSFVIVAGTEPRLVRADLTCDACALLNCQERESSRRCVYREDDP